MKGYLSKVFISTLAMGALGLFLFPAQGRSVLARTETTVSTKIKHKPVEYFVSGHRIGLQAHVTDEKGVHLVRCYFRAVEQADYVFVTMKAGSSRYSGVLPAPSQETDMIEYLFLAVNGKNQVVKTQTFKITKGDDDKIPAWQKVSAKGEIQVGTELARAPTAPVGFSDSIAVNVAESSARFGFVVGGIYTAIQASESGGTSGMAAAADSAGMITAKTGGVSKLAYVGGAALIAAGVAAAGSGSSSDRDHKHTYLSSSTTSVQPLSSTTTYLSSSTTTSAPVSSTTTYESSSTTTYLSSSTTTHLSGSDTSVQPLSSTTTHLSSSTTTSAPASSTTTYESSSTTTHLSSSTTTYPVTTTYWSTTTFLSSSTTTIDDCRYNSPPDIYYACVSEEPLHVGDTLTV
jgi:hypothetical protein